MQSKVMSDGAIAQWRTERHVKPTPSQRYRRRVETAASWIRKAGLSDRTLMDVIDEALRHGGKCVLCENGTGDHFQQHFAKALHLYITALSVQGKADGCVGCQSPSCERESL